MGGFFLFLDGVGLGDDDPEVNPFAANHLPNTKNLLAGRRLILDDAGYSDNNMVFNAIDANLGVQGIPQSASGQAAILTGKNAPLITGQHYGPKPNQPLRELIQQGTLISELVEAGKQVQFLNAYPDPYFENINSGKRLHGTFPYAISLADIRLNGTRDLIEGRGVSADFTGKGWHEHLNLKEVPILTPEQAGRNIHKMQQQADLTILDYWPSDIAGHHQSKDEAAGLLHNLDGMLEGLMEDFDPKEDWLLITSDHGNIESLTTRRHTSNPVPLIYFGPAAFNKTFTLINDLTGIKQAILTILS